MKAEREKWSGRVTATALRFQTGQYELAEEEEICRIILVSGGILFKCAPFSIYILSFFLPDMYIYFSAVNHNRFLFKWRKCYNCLCFRYWYCYVFHIRKYIRRK